MANNPPHGKIDWLASYVKSGNTWMRMLLANYFNEADQPLDINGPDIISGIASSRRLFDEYLGVSSSDMTAGEIEVLQPQVYEMMVENNPDRQWLKVHDAQKQLDDGRWLFPPELSGVVIYLIRNPLDVAVSMAFHDGHQDMEKATRKICNPGTILASDKATQLRQFTGSWSDHVESWVDQWDIPVKTVRYEDLLADTADELAQVITFARPDEKIDPMRVQKAVDNAAFDKLQEAEEKEIFLEKPPKAEVFFRSGKAGDWRNHLSSDQVSRIRECHYATMERFGYVR